MPNPDLITEKFWSDLWEYSKYISGFLIYAIAIYLIFIAIRKAIELIKNLFY